MKKEQVMKQIRMSVVGLLGCAAFILMCGEPTNEETWWQSFFIGKGLAFLFGYITYILCKRWESKGLLPEMDEDI